MDAPQRQRLGRVATATGTMSLVASGAFAYAWAMELADGGVEMMRSIGILFAVGVGLLSVGRVMARERRAEGMDPAGWPRDEDGRVQWPCHACDAFSPVDFGFCLRCGTEARGERLQAAWRVQQRLEARRTRA